jgi:hypothetical protein
MKPYKPHRMHFEAHGSFALRVEGNVLVFEGRGPFNLECSMEFLRAVGSLAQALACTGPWGCISIYHRNALFPLESVALLRENVALAARRMKLVANCWVVAPTVEGYGLINPVARQAYEGLTPFEIFETEAPAWAWMHRELHAAADQNSCGGAAGATN